MTPGQLQHFSIARAMLRTKQIRPSLSVKDRRKEILLLDEATSSLDPATENVVQDLVEEHSTKRGHKVIMVSKPSATESRPFLPF